MVYMLTFGVYWWSMLPYIIIYSIHGSYGILTIHGHLTLQAARPVVQGHQAQEKSEDMEVGKIHGAMASSHPFLDSKIDQNRWKTWRCPFSEDVPWNKASSYWGTLIYGNPHITEHRTTEASWIRVTSGSMASAVQSSRCRKSRGVWSKSSMVMHEHDTGSWKPWSGA